MKLIVGLGNPGKDYAHTRHNVGWRVVDGWGLNFSVQKKFHADVARHSSLSDVLVCKPQTFMNNSGQAVREIVDYYKIPTEQVLVVYDDKDLAFGTIRIRSTGSSGGHNGVQSIIQHLGTQDFGRVRVGVGSAFLDTARDTASFVLDRFSADEEKHLPEIIKLAHMVMLDICTHDQIKLHHQDITAELGG